MQIKGLYETDTGFFDLQDETGAIIDKILLKKGTGSYTRQFTSDGVSRGGRKYNEICGICIRLFAGEEVVGRWQGTGEILSAANFPVKEILCPGAVPELPRMERQTPKEKGKKTGRTCSQRTGTGGKAGNSAETHAGMDSAGESDSYSEDSRSQMPVPLSCRQSLP